MDESRWSNNSRQIEVNHPHVAVTIILRRRFSRPLLSTRLICLDQSFVCFSYFFFFWFPLLHKDIRGGQKKTKNNNHEAENAAMPRDKKTQGRKPQKEKMNGSGNSPAPHPRDTRCSVLAGGEGDQSTQQMSRQAGHGAPQTQAQLTPPSSAVTVTTSLGISEDMRRRQSGLHASCRVDCLSRPCGR